MIQSQLFTKTRADLSAKVSSKNARLLIRAGFIDQLAAGVYTFLPLGLRVLNKIEDLIRKEINAIGGQEILMAALQPKKHWQITDRWSEDVMFKTKSLAGQEYGLGWTHEENVTPLVGKHLSSYKDLPLSIYQIQTKFRDEKRAKSGLLRGREFRMKDLYSFHLDEADLDKYYEQVKTAYFKIFEQAGLAGKTYLTFASGGAFSKFSHEFQAICEVGEDVIHLCQKCQVAINQEIIQEQSICPDCGGKSFDKLTAIEVGNIFKLKTRFSDSFNLKVKDQSGQDKTVFMGCYGIGSSRLMGAIAEILSDEHGLVWPPGLAPFKYHLIILDKNKLDFGRKIYNQLGEDNVLFDDRFNLSNGERLTEADLLGLSVRLVVSPKTGDKIEVKNRSEQKVELIDSQRLGDKLISND